MVAHRDRSTTTTDRAADLRVWIQTLDSLGVDTADVLAEELSAFGRAENLNRISARVRANGNPNPKHEARRLALLEVADYESVVAEATNIAFLSEGERYETVLEILSTAGDYAEQAAADAFRKRRDGVLDLVRARFEAVAEEGARLWEELPEGMSSLAIAARFGWEDVWLRLEELARDWANIRELIRAWLVAGIITNDVRPNVGVFDPNVFMFADLQAHLATGVYGNKVRIFAASAATAQPKLMTIQEIRDRGSADIERDDTNAAWHRELQARADDAAVSRIQARKPQPLVLGDGGHSLVPAPNRR
jgi:hypothetical protein